MRIYDEPVDVRRGLVGEQEAPEQFIWREKLWVVTAIVSHWVETGAWWEQAGVTELLGVVSPAEARWSSRASPAGGQAGSSPVSPVSPVSSPAGGQAGSADQSSSPTTRWSSLSRPQPGSGLDPSTGLRTAKLDHREGLDTAQPAAPLGADLLAERELWRVEAARGRLARFVGPHASGVFDLCFDWAAGQWTLTRTLD